MVQICSIEINVYLCPVTDKHIYTMKRTWTVYFGLQSQAETKEFQATIKAYTLSEASLKMTKWLNDREFEQHPEVVDRLWENAEYFKAGIKQLGIDTGHTETPIVPVMLGDVKLAKEFSAKLFDYGVFAMALGFPTVPKGQARIRVMNTAAHSREDLDKGLEIFGKVARELGVI